MTDLQEALKRIEVVILREMAAERLFEEQAQEKGHSYFIKHYRKSRKEAKQALADVHAMQEKLETES